MPVPQERLPEIPDTLDGSMTRSQVAEVLEHLRFGRHNGKATIELDRHIAHYLASLIKPRTHRAA